MLIKTDQDIIQSYFEDESGLLGGHAEFAAVPENEKEVSEFLKDASGKKLPVTISGAGTGVTGGRIAFGGAVLSTEKLNRFIELKRNASGATAVVQPGLSIRELKAEAMKNGLMYPPDPTEQNSWIGGNVSTNASGSRGFKYGPTRRYIKRLKVALSTGEILDIERGKYPSSGGKLEIPAKNRFTVTVPSYKLPAIKNAAGYFNYPGMDLIDLFIGHEGTLGVVTEVEVSLIPLADKTLGGIVFFKTREDAWNFVREAKVESAENKQKGNEAGINALSLEYFDAEALALLKPDYPNIPVFAKAAIFFEQEAAGQFESAVMDAWSSLIEESGAPLDSVWFSTAPKDQQSFREFRHRMPEKVNEIVHANKFPKTGTDMAVPDARLREMLDFIYGKLESSGIQHLVFGHIGESHVHANILPASEEEYKACRSMYLALAGKAVELGGTVSAEHGIGKIKHAFLEKMLGKSALQEMANLKKSLDPACILGLGNIFPKELL